MRRDRRQVRRVDAERGRHRRFVAHDGDPAVVGHVERLVGVGRPRVRALGARHQVPQARGCRRPQPERAVDVHPGAVQVRDVDRRREVVERAGVHVTGLKRDDRRAVVRLPARRSGRRHRSGPARRLRRSPALRGRRGARRARPRCAPRRRRGSGSSARSGCRATASWPRSRSTASRATIERGSSRSWRRSRIRPRCPPGGPSSSSSQLAATSSTAAVAGVG